MVNEAENNTTSLTLTAVEKFNSAFNRHDVEAVMNAMTEDCVFENTNPPPDGSRFIGAIVVRAFWEKFFLLIRMRGGDICYRPSLCCPVDLSRDKRRTTMALEGSGHFHSSKWQSGRKIVLCKRLKV